MGEKPGGGGGTPFGNVGVKGGCIVGCNGGGGRGSGVCGAPGRGGRKAVDGGIRKGTGNAGC